MNIYEKVKELCDKKGISIYRLERDCNLSNGSVKKWIKSLPNAETLQKVALRLDTKIDVLLTDDVPQNADTTYTDSEMYTFPVIGAICAGYDGNSEFSATGEELPVPKYLLKTHNPSDYFVLEVKGDSMYPLFMNGDKVLIRKCDSVESGRVAAVGFDEEDATLKKVEYVNGEDWMRLIPRNPEYPTKVIKGADLDQCRIYGEVVYKFSDNVNF